MQRIITAFILIFSFTFLSAQNCSQFFPFDEGVTFEISNYDKRDKLTSSAKHKVTNKRSIPGGMIADIELEMFDKDGESFNSAVYEVKCVNNIFYLDMKSMVNQEQFGGIDAEATFHGDLLQFPENFEPETTLPDASLTIDVGSGGSSLLSMVIDVTNRRTGTNERVTTPAGTFDCVTMMFDTNTKMMVNIKSSSKSWYAKDVGMVRTENFNKKGKLTGYSVLTDILR